jgi:hypothetical protein
VFVRLILVALALAATTAAAAASPSIGINYLWWKLTPVSERECRAEGEPRAVGSWVVPNYSDAAVRRAAIGHLRAMRRAGFTTLRTVFIYARSSESDPTAFASTDGSVSAADKAKIGSFVRDVARAGFKTLEIASSFDSENWVYCHVRAWGDCFDPRLTADNWRFISQTARTALDAAGTLSLRFDLGNEEAPDPHMPPQTLARAKTYFQTIAGRFQASFGDDWLISAARSDASTATETRERLNLLVADLAEAGLRPKYLELHTYSADGNDVAESLSEAQAIAERIDASVVLGELRYHSGVQAAAIAGWLAKHPSSRVVDLILWPEYDPSLACAPLPEPPYTPGPLAVPSPSPSAAGATPPSSRWGL